LEKSSRSEKREICCVHLIKQRLLFRADLEVAGDSEGESRQDLLSEKPDARPTWGSKAQYILAQVGFSVGLGNVWRFPYLCHQNGGGSFLLLYLLLLFIIGIPFFFLELAAGQIIRQGSIGVWKHISPCLIGIGFASCVVCSFVALYYNVIMAWSLFYLGSSFQFPLPWSDCPGAKNETAIESECMDSSPTIYFWNRKALHITDSIEESGGLDPALTGCLFAAWMLVCLAMIKGIKSSGKVEICDLFVCLTELVSGFFLSDVKFEGLDFFIIFLFFTEDFNVTLQVTD
uniref:Transporter n=1 Tax=Laticauda laticaudata TaxID=8630 RepID=A0A8C5S9Y3_LATLA